MQALCRLDGLASDRQHITMYNEKEEAWGPECCCPYLSHMLLRTTMGQFSKPKPMVMDQPERRGCPLCSGVHISLPCFPFCCLKHSSPCQSKSLVENPSLIRLYANTLKLEHIARDVCCGSCGCVCLACSCSTGDYWLGWNPNPVKARGFHSSSDSIGVGMKLLKFGAWAFPPMCEGGDWHGRHCAWRIGFAGPWGQEMTNGVYVMKVWIGTGPSHEHPEHPSSWEDNWRGVLKDWLTSAGAFSVSERVYFLCLNYQPT